MSAGAGPSGVALGVDLGTERIGLARTNPSRTLASPWRVLRTRGVRGPGADPEVTASLVQAAEDCEATVVVVGVPFSLSGAKGPAARRALGQIEALRAALGARGVAVETVDERFSTHSAHQALAAAGRRERARRPRIDAAAAAVLLEAWLQGARPGVGTP